LPVEAVADGVPVERAKPADASPALPEAVAASNRVATNVPARLPLLFGRETDVEAVKGLLARYVVVTVAGAGGIGKTRVAQAVADRSRPNAPEIFPTASGGWTWRRFPKGRRCPARWRACWGRAQ
jgi:hypothetical protein